MSGRRLQTDAFLKYIAARNAIKMYSVYFDPDHITTFTSFLEEFQMTSMPSFCKVNEKAQERSYLYLIIMHSAPPPPPGISGAFFHMIRSRGSSINLPQGIFWPRDFHLITLSLPFNDKCTIPKIFNLCCSQSKQFCTRIKFL